MAKMHVDPVISLLFLPLGSSTRSDIFLDGGIAYFNTCEVGNLGANSQALDLAEVDCDD